MIGKIKWLWATLTIAVAGIMAFVASSPAAAAALSLCDKTDCTGSNHNQVLL